MRGSPADVIRPNCTLLKLFCGLFHWNQFSALNDSMRASMRWLPLKRNDFTSDRSRKCWPGPYDRVALHVAERAHRRRGERRAIVDSCPACRRHRGRRGSGSLAGRRCRCGRGHPSRSLTAATLNRRGKSPTGASPMPALAAKSLSNCGVSALARQVEEVTAIGVARTVVVVDVVRIHVAGVDVGRGASLRRMARALRQRVVGADAEPAGQRGAARSAAGRCTSACRAPCARRSNPDTCRPA